ncbi:MAG TPA: hypothetical protein VN516_08870 [Candidatus Baltobacteraceae bacterium]|nr:hypothetical protein [Candidatus Baltobacteraceae bacterium]
MIATANRIQEIEPVVTPFEPLPVERSREKFFTLDGDGALEMHIERTCKKILAGVQKIILPQQLEGVLLGGGYGRGEGGVLRTQNGDRPYNDLEFYILVRGNDWLNQKIYGRRLHRLAQSLSPEAGAEIEFEIISRKTLSESPASMFYYDLVSAHRWFLGDESLLGACEHHRQARDIPMSEATRLLMNRCSGLLFAKERLESKSFDDTDADFVSRNIAKAQLALGDAVLTVFGQYHWSALVRNRRLLELEPDGDLSWISEVRHHHEAGLKFKFHPQINSSREALQLEHEKISALAQQVWLWLENRRLDCHFLSMRGYALSSLNKCPETDAERNKLVNAKVFGFHAYFKTRSEHHPRERVLDALAILLWLPWREKSDLQRCLEKQLKHDLSVGEFFQLAIVKAIKLFSGFPVVGKFFSGFEFMSRQFDFMDAYRKLWCEVK